MKRRKFILAGAGLLSLFGSTSGWAQRKKKKKSTRSRSRAPLSRTLQPKNSAARSILDRPPPGSSATSLPRCKAPNRPNDWQAWQISIRFDLPNDLSIDRHWLPIPASQGLATQRQASIEWQSNAARTAIYRLEEYQTETLTTTWSDFSLADSKPQRTLELNTVMYTADRVFDITRRSVPPEHQDVLKRYLRATHLIPNQGEIRQLGKQIVGRVIDPLAQARQFFNWVAKNSVYRPDQVGCGVGDVKSQIANKQYGGKSADINGLFVALCRNFGIPARLAFGLRVANSRLVQDGSAEKKSHDWQCRAEFYVPGYAWIPADPAEVCRLAHAGRTIFDEKVFAEFRRAFFGAWERNWVLFNYAEQVPLPNAAGTSSYFMGPYMEYADGAIFNDEVQGYFNESYQIEVQSIES